MVHPTALQRRYSRFVSFAGHTSLVWCSQITFLPTSAPLLHSYTFPCWCIYMEWTNSEGHHFCKVFIPLTTLLGLQVLVLLTEYHQEKYWVSVAWHALVNFQCFRISIIWSAGLDCSALISSLWQFQFLELLLIYPTLPSYSVVKY